MESILTSIKKLLGIEEDYEQFDVDIIMHINTIFTVLTQLGVGPSAGFSIKDKTATWEDFLGSASTNIISAKTYMALRVRLLFDPPTSSVVIEAIKETIKELEWRLTVATETTT